MTAPTGQSSKGAAPPAYLVSKRRRVHGRALARDLTVAGIGVLFSLWVNTGQIPPVPADNPSGDSAVPAPQTSR